MRGGGWQRADGAGRAGPGHAILTLAAAVETVRPVLQNADAGLVAILDVRGMGAINARCGREAGDRLLGAIERSLRRKLADCRVARLPGDQFIVVRPDPADPERTRHRIERASHARVLSRWGRVVHTAARTGVAEWHDDRSRRTVIRAAAAQLQQ